jgi:hypothetical protein
MAVIRAGQVTVSAMGVVIPPSPGEALVTRSALAGSVCLQYVACCLTGKAPAVPAEISPAPAKATAVVAAAMATAMRLVRKRQISSMPANLWVGPTRFSDFPGIALKPTPGRNGFVKRRRIGENAEEPPGLFESCCETTL